MFTDSTLTGSVGEPPFSVVLCRSPSRVGEHSLLLSFLLPQHVSGKQCLSGPHSKAQSLPDRVSSN